MRANTEALAKKVRSLLGEFVNSQDLGEAKLCVEELKAPNHLHWVVKHAILYGADSKADMRDNYRNLLVKLATEKVLTAEHFAKGATEVVALLDGELSEDLPNAGVFMGGMVGYWVAQGIVDLGAVLSSGFSNLSSLQTEKLAGSTLAALLAAKDAAFVSAEWQKASLSLAAFVKDPKKIASFLETYKLSELSLN